jgi:hypothetical protein
MTSSSAVDRRFAPRLGLIKGYEIGMCCFSAKHEALKLKELRLVLLESG